MDVTSETKQNPTGKMWGEIESRGAEAYEGAMGKFADVFLRVGSVRIEEEYDELVN